jgi:hypothetical protein
MNVDGAFRPSELKGGGDGLVVTDCHGGFVLEALLVARDAQIQRVELETDNVKVAAKLRRKG